MDKSYTIRYRLFRTLRYSNYAERNWSWPTTYKCDHKGSYEKCKWIIAINKHWQTKVCFLATSECRVPHKVLWHDNTVFVYKLCWHVLLNPWRRVLLEQLTHSQLVKKFSSFYWTRRFITAFISASHLSLSWPRSIQSMSHPTSWRSILILYFHLLLFLPSGLFPHQNPVCTSRLPHKWHNPRSSYTFRFDHSTNIGWGAQIMKPLIM